jgi:type I restriction enzyme S subunit
MALGLSPTQIIEKGEYQLLEMAEHWERVFLSDIVHVQNGAAFKSEFFDRFSGVPLIRIRDISGHETEHRYTGEYEETYVINHGDILVGMDGDFVAARWRGKKALLNQRVCKLTIQNEHIDEYFFFVCLQPYLNAINAETSSVTVKHLSSRTIEAIPIPLPALNEQHRIVTKIEELFSELDNGIKSLKTAREQLKLYRQAVLKHAFEGKLTADWREQNKDKLETADQLLARIKTERKARHQQQLADWKAAAKEWEADGKQGKRPSKPKISNAFHAPVAEGLSKLPQLADGHAFAYLAALGDLGRGKSKHRPRNDPLLFGGGYPFIQTSEVKAANRVIKSHSQTYSEFGLEQSKLWPKGTLCITIAANIAETSFLGFDGCFPDSVVGFSANPHLVLPEYIELFIKAVRARIEAYAPATAQKNINLTTLENLIVPMCSIEEQKFIIDEIEVVFSILDKNEEIIEEVLMRAKTLRQSVLKKAFSGQLVEQDPNDEPASVLLERIRVEKAAKGKAHGKKERMRYDCVHT